MGLCKPCQFDLTGAATLATQIHVIIWSDTIMQTRIYEMLRTGQGNEARIRMHPVSLCLSVL